MRPVGPVADPPPPVNTEPPYIELVSGSGPLAAGQHLKGVHGTWHSPDPITYAVQWERCNASGADCVDIARATHDGYTVTADDVSGTLVFAVTATDSESQTTTVDSEPYNGVGG